MKNSTLLVKIEQCREEMITLSCSHELNSDVVVQSSSQLDKLINEYNREVNQEP